MRILSLVILFIVLYLSNQKTESPHGSEFKVSCKTCHSSKGWQLDKEIYSFDHSKTKLPLTGQHTEINCRLCHKTLIFSAAKSECNQCHNDIHQNTVGLDCSRVVEGFIVLFILTGVSMLAVLDLKSTDDELKRNE